MMVFPVCVMVSWYNEDKVEICFEEIMRVEENDIDLTHVANDLKRLRFHFPSFQIEF